MASELTGRWIPLFLFNGDKAVSWARREEREFYIDFGLILRLCEAAPIGRFI